MDGGAWRRAVPSASVSSTSQGNSTLPSASRVARASALGDAELGVGLDRALGDLLVGDLGAAGERGDVAHALGEGADEGGAGGGLGDGEEGAGVLGADVVLQLVRARAGPRSPRPRRCSVISSAEVPGEGDRLGHPLRDRVEVGHRPDPIPFGALDGTGRTHRAQRPSNLAWPGPPCSRKVLTAFCRSSVAKSSAASVRIASSAAGDAALAEAAEDVLGHRVRLGRAGGQLGGEGARALLEVLVVEDPVDDAPALQLLGAEDLAGHHELGGRGRCRRARRGAACRPSTASARPLSRPGRTWPCGRRRSGRRRGRSRRRRSGSARGRRRRSAPAALELVDRPQQLVPEPARPAPASARRRRGRRRRRRRRGPRRGSAAPAAARPRRLGDRRLEVVDHPLVEEVQRRAVEGQHGEAALLALQSAAAALIAPAPDAPRTGWCPAPGRRGRR